ncbi:hypothetical protein EPN28_03535 [Patescibacteria group bacterium]|nr:MAG: hypothetical protein EPN28_03535 [Patescibacteria group bacterium]
MNKLPKIRPIDKKRYVLKEDRDYFILGKIYELESKKMTAEDKKMVKFIRTQMIDDWRAPIMKKLDELLKKYK